MKKILFLLLFIVNSFVSYSQAVLGVKAGFNLTSFNASYVTDVSYSSKTNFNAGLILSFPFGSGLSLQPEAFYSGEGADIKTNSTTGVYSFQMLNIPVLLKYVSPIHLFAETGPQAGFLLGAELTEKEIPSTDIKEQTKSPDFSWAFGVGYQLPAGLGLDIRYNLGLTDMSKGSNNTYNEGSFRSSVFQIGIYYLFPNLFPAEKN
jgi:hypothetical protein